MIDSKRQNIQNRKHRLLLWLWRSFRRSEVRIRRPALQRSDFHDSNSTAAPQMSRLPAPIYRKPQTTAFRKASGSANTRFWSGRAPGGPWRLSRGGVFGVPWGS